jgi:hypothetical protein
MDHEGLHKYEAKPMILFLDTMSHFLGFLNQLIIIPNYYGKLAILRICNKVYHLSHIFIIIDSQNIEYTLKHLNLFLPKTPRKPPRDQLFQLKGKNQLKLL